MNADRRNRIQEILGLVSELREKIEEIRGEEQDAFDNMPESLQQSERGQTSESAASSLGEAVGYCDDIESALDSASE